MAKGMTYADAGVSIDAGNELVKRIAPLARSTYSGAGACGRGRLRGVLRARLSEPPLPQKLPQPRPRRVDRRRRHQARGARLAGRHDTVGIDLVAMCVNDIVVCGAEPLFFLDYFATGRLDVDVARGRRCRHRRRAATRPAARCSAGRRPSMPGFYDDSATTTWRASRSAWSSGRRSSTACATVAGDVILGVASTGLHSNGYSLARKVVFERAGLGVDDVVPRARRHRRRRAARPDAHLRRGAQTRRPPTTASSASSTASPTSPAAASSTTCPRVLPDGFAPRSARHPGPCRPSSAARSELGEIDDEEMHRIFNMGIGMVIVVSPYYADALARSLEQRRRDRLPHRRHRPHARRNPRNPE